MATMVRWDPLRDLTALRDDMLRAWGSSPFARTAGDAGTQVWSPPLDVIEHADALVVTVELPGLKPEDIDIEVDDNVLTVKGERKFEQQVEDGRYYRLERSYGRFQRSLGLPQGVRADEISAGFEHGVLEVRVPKAEEVKPRKIAVGTA